MRRMAWLAAGAVLGIAGYRRVDRAAKSLTGQLGSGPVTRQAVQVHQAQAQGARPSRELPSQQASSGLRTFAGLALSLAAGIARQAGAVRARRAARARAGLVGERRASIGAFIGDVRDGMDEYLDARAGQVETRTHPEIGSSKI